MPYYIALINDLIIQSSEVTVAISLRFVPDLSTLSVTSDVSPKSCVDVSVKLHVCTIVASVYCT